MNRPVHVILPVVRDENGYPPFDEEEVDATSLGQGLWRLESSPTFSYGVARGDIVRATSGEYGAHRATEVVSSAGNWCARVVPANGASVEDVQSVLRGFGWEVHTTEYQLIVVEFDADVDPVPSVLLLERGQIEGRWHFDLGVDPRR